MYQRLLTCVVLVPVFLFSAYEANSQSAFEPMNVDEKLTIVEDANPPPPPSRWLQFLEQPNGERGYIDRQSIKRLVQGIYAWVKFENVEGQKNKTLLERWSVNCRSWQIGTLDSLVYYKEGDIPVAQNISTRPDAIAPDSLGEIVARMYCSKRR